MRVVPKVPSRRSGGGRHRSSRRIPRTANPDFDSPPYSFVGEKDDLIVKNKNKKLVYVNS